MRIACPDWNVEGASFTERAGRIMKMGFDAVECGTRIAGIEGEIEKASHDSCRISTLWCAHVKGGWSDNPDTYDAAKRELESYIDLCGRVGAKGVVLTDHVVPESFSEYDRKSAFKRLVEYLALMAERAVNANCAVFIEPLHANGRELVSTIDDARSICHSVGSPGLRICADTYHMHANGENIPVAIEAAGKHIGHVHFSDHVRATGKRPLPGFGNIDFFPVCTALDRVGYDGYVAIEGSVPTGMDTDEANLECLDLLQGISAPCTRLPDPFCSTLLRHVRQWSQLRHRRVFVRRLS